MISFQPVNLRGAGLRGLGDGCDPTDLACIAAGGAVAGGAAAASTGDGTSFWGKLGSFFLGVGQKLISPGPGGTCPAGYAPNGAGGCVSIAPPTPWYKTPLGMLGIAAGVVGVGYVGYRLVQD